MTLRLFAPLFIIKLTEVCVPGLKINLIVSPPVSTPSVFLTRRILDISTNKHITHRQTIHDRSLLLGVSGNVNPLPCSHNLKGAA